MAFRPRISIEGLSGAKLQKYELVFSENESKHLKRWGIIGVKADSKKGKSKKKRSKKGPSKNKSSKKKSSKKSSKRKASKKKATDTAANQE
ncbi:hypothetical protein ACHAPT_010746 [Fusarium lateritium]